VWINGHAIGRYWDIGPQDTLYVPGPWLHKGWNSVVVFDIDGLTKPHLAGLAKPILDGPTRGTDE
jgi:beta-galactosidase